MIKKFLLILAFMFLMIPGALALTDEQYITCSNVSIQSYSTYTSTVVLNTVDTGYSGSNITLTIADPTKARFTAIQIPAWSIFHSESALPASTLTFVEVDGNSLVNPGDSNILLATVTIEWLANGTTSFVSNTNASIDDDSGNHVDYTPVAGTITLEDTTEIQTLPASQNSTSFLTLEGSCSMDSSVVFDYGTTPDMALRTSPKFVSAGVFNETIPNPVPAATYYFRAVESSGNSSGVVLSTYVSQTPGDLIPVPTYTNRLNQLAGAGNNFSQLNTIITSEYTDIMGGNVGLFYAILWIAIFGAIFIRSGSVRIPTFLYILVTSIMMFGGIFPQNILMFVYASLALAFGAMAFSIYKKI